MPAKANKPTPMAATAPVSFPDKMGAAPVDRDCALDDVVVVLLVEVLEADEVLVVLDAVEVVDSVSPMAPILVRVGLTTLEALRVIDVLVEATMLLTDEPVSLHWETSSITAHSWPAKQYLPLGQQTSPSSGL